MSLLKKYDTIIFDFGQVIVDLNYPACLHAFQKWGAEELKVKQLFGYTSFHKEYEKGEMHTELFIDLCNDFLETSISEPDFRAAWNLMVGDMPKRRMDFLLALKEQKQVILLSNTNEIHEEYFEEKIRQDFGVQGMAHFVHHPLYSHRIGLRKPDLEIYEYVKQHHVAEGQALFLDDRMENVEAAKSAGIDAIRVEFPDQIFEILK